MIFIKKILPLLLLFCSLSANLLKPYDNQIISYSHILFEWEQNPNAVSYQLQISDSQNFQNGFIANILTDQIVYIYDDEIQWNETYYWRVRDIYFNESYGPWTIPNTFFISEKRFGDNGDGIEIDFYDQNQSSNDLTLLGDLSGGLNLISYVFDQNGNEIWNGDLMINHINKYGQIFGSTYTDFPNYTGIKMNYDGDILWNGPNGTYIDIHEVKSLPNGNYMAFVWEYTNGPIPLGDWTSVYRALGYEADGITNEYPWFGQAIIEWDENSNEVWRWNPFDHFTMDDYDAYGGTWWDAINGGQYDWMHSNAFHFDQEESVIYLSSRHLSRITKIDYPSGQVIWNIGPSNSYEGFVSDHICTDLEFTWQHNVQMLDNGNLLLFDNGNLSQLFGTDRPTSRVIEFKVIDDTYCEMVWEYSLPDYLFGPWMGSVQKLDNNNYFINTVGSGGHAIEINETGQLLWDGKYQITDYPTDPAGNYRSYKVPSLHPNAYSVIFENFESYDGNVGIYLSDNLNISISNMTGYKQYYEYNFGDQNNWFNSVNESIIIEPYSSHNLSFDPIIINDATTNIQFNIIPTYHDYDMKSYNFSVFNNQLLGDINFDDLINILDVVVLVNIIIEQQSYNYIADLNQDEIINILDVVAIINIILEQ